MVIVTIKTETPEMAAHVIQVLTELERATINHPDWSAFDPVHMAAIVSEESGEAVRAALQYQFEGGPLEEVKKELIQTGAMCIRALMNLPDIKEVGHE